MDTAASNAPQLAHNVTRLSRLDLPGAGQVYVAGHYAYIGHIPNKQQIANVGYVAMAANYAKLGQFCDAATAINSWVSINPVRNDTSQMRAIIGDYTAKGRCPTGAASPPARSDRSAPARGRSPRAINTCFRARS